MATVTANSGSYTIVGAQAFRALVMVAAVGSYAVTGTAATTRHGYQVSPAVSGSYTLTGTPIQTRRIAAEPAGYIVTGQAVTLSVGTKKVVAVAGSYTYTGTTATKLDHSVPSDRGNYGLTGSTVNLSRSAPGTFQVASGTYTIVGGPTVLEQILLIDTGDYNITGTAALLVRNQKRINALGSSYNYAAGPQALLKWKHIFHVVETSYSVTGSVVNLVRSTGAAKFIIGDFGTFIIPANTNTTLRLGRRVIATSGTYTITGTAMTPRVSMPAGTISYTITGTSVNLNKGRLIPANSGSYTVFTPDLVVDATHKSNSGATSGSSATWSHTVIAGPNRILTVEESHIANQSNRFTSGVTYNGIALVAGPSVTSGGGGVFRFTSLWYLINPPVTTANIVVTYAAAITNGFASGVSLTGAAQTVPVRVSNFLSGTSTTPSITLGSGGSIDNLIIDGLVHIDTTITGTGAGQTQLQNTTITGGGAGSSYKAGSDPAVSPTTSWTISLSAGWSLVAAEFKAFGPTVLRKGTASFNRFLVVDSGSYLITGLASRFNHSIGAFSGTYGTTGTVASLLRRRAISAGIGIYAVTGTDAFVGKRTPIAIGVGSYTITGQTATLRVTHKVAANIGSYSIVGTQASLNKSGTPKKIDAIGGIYTLTGTPATVTSSGKLINIPIGSYTITGSPVIFIITRAVVDPGLYFIQGTAATLRTSQVNRWRKHPRHPSIWSKQPIAGLTE